MKKAMPLHSLIRLAPLSLTSNWDSSKQCLIGDCTGCYPLKFMSATEKVGNVGQPIKLVCAHGGLRST